MSQKPASPRRYKHPVKKVASQSLAQSTLSTFYQCNKISGGICSNTGHSNPDSRAQAFSLLLSTRWLETGQVSHSISLTFIIYHSFEPWGRIWIPCPSCSGCLDNQLDGLSWIPDQVAAPGELGGILNSPLYCVEASPVHLTPTSGPTRVFIFLTRNAHWNTSNPISLPSAFPKTQLILMTRKQALSVDRVA